MMAGRSDREGDSSGSGTTRHIPVMLAQVLAALAPIDGEHYVDATYGAGGYSSAILAAANCFVLALDRDPRAVAAAAAACEASQGRLKVVESPFSALEKVVGDEPPAVLDGIVFDIGVSSMQLDQADRGFSFQHDGPLDMRMASSGATAADLVNSADERDIADILYLFGEEKRSRAIARAIVDRRRQAAIRQTADLAALVERVIGRKPGDPKHPATRTFQALRIAVNDELGELASGLAAAERLLRPGGRLIVVTFHSLEDRIVKEFLRDRSGRAPRGSRHLPAEAAEREASFHFINPHPLSPGEDEIVANPRSRSARLRWAVRTTAAAFPAALAEALAPRLRRR